ncbi:von Willebrand factor A domain-containing protein 5A-like isoform X2 [Labeo rohita]|uniref:von Willebrand factor A domain-containing protein 5A-like isoform X2 n=1 Tax=Labeo rohita TaxID=84645 RepID=UPI0021E1D7E9|nr:von Willebrand factor A domain-containing protein 5A-like isoform X2 [Labeo rohita]
MVLMEQLCLTSVNKEVLQIWMNLLVRDLFVDVYDSDDMYCELDDDDADFGYDDRMCCRFSRMGISRPSVGCQGSDDDLYDDGYLLAEAASEPQKDLLLQLVSLQKASGCWDLDATLADVFGKTEDELTNQKPAQVDGSVWATLLALIWLYGCKIEQQVEWQFVAMKAASWIGSQKVGVLSQCVCVGNVLLGCQVTKEALGI